MPAVDLPVIHQPQVALEVMQQVVARHDAAGEEIPRHPVALVAHLEGVGEPVVREDVHEQRRTGVHPRGDVGEQRLVVAHVLEHLDGDHPVEARADVEVELVRVAGDDLQVRQPALGGAGVDERLLGARVRHPGDARVRVVLGHPQRQRAPAAAELQDAVAVLQARPLAGEREHARFRRAEVGRRARHVEVVVEAARILEVRPQRLEVERGRYLVVLRVGGVGVDGDRALAQPPHHRHEVRLLRLGPALVLLGETLREQRADAVADERVRHPVGLEQAHRQGGLLVFGHGSVPEVNLWEARRSMGSSRRYST